VKNVNGGEGEEVEDGEEDGEVDGEEEVEDGGEVDNMFKLDEVN